MADTTSSHNKEFLLKKKSNQSMKVNVFEKAARIR